MALILGATFVVSRRVIFENFGAGVTLQTRAPFHPRDEIGTPHHDLDIVVQIDGT